MAAAVPQRKALGGVSWSLLKLLKWLANVLNATITATTQY